MTLQNTNLSGKVALVTGASQGIGLATAQTLAEYGATVVLTARRKDIIETEAAAIRDSGGNAHAIVCDVTQYSSFKSAIDQTVEEFSQLDILVNNAGMIDPLARISDSDPDVWSKAVDTNVKGVYHGLRASIPHMEQQGSGIIVNISSGAANSALEGWSHYCSSKAAAQKLTEVAHKEVSEQGIRVVGLSPGTVATDMMSKIKESGVNVVSNLDWSVHIPPKWAGEGVVFLCGDGGAEFAGTDFSIKTPEGRRLVGLPIDGAPD